jgi:hypothetical protein
VDETRNYSISVMAVFLFKTGTQANEKNFMPDEVLIREMIKRNIRVQDLFCKDNEAVKKLFLWYKKKGASFPAP